MQVDGGWHAPRAPLLAVPLNMTSGYRLYTMLNTSLAWVNQWAPEHVPVLKKGKTRRRQQRRSLLEFAGDGKEERADGDAIKQSGGVGSRRSRRRLLGMGGQHTRAAAAAHSSADVAADWWGDDTVGTLLEGGGDAQHDGSRRRLLSAPMAAAGAGSEDPHPHSYYGRVDKEEGEEL